MSPFKALLLKRTSFTVTLICIIVSVTLTAYFTSGQVKGLMQERKESFIDKGNVNKDCDYHQKRLSGYSYIRPLLYVEKECQSEELAIVRAKVIDLIEKSKVNLLINSASVYLKDCSSSEWMGINENEKYNPGSLLKLPILITFLKMDELHPGLLDRKIKYERNYDIGRTPVIVSKQIEIGKTYKIGELLVYMVTCSDNNATTLLGEQMDMNIFLKTFTDLGLEKPTLYSKEYPISAKAYSYFLRAIYNSTYLSHEDSEFAAELLLTCNFKDGLKKGLPQYVQLAHKFGETGNASEKQLHEAGIIYQNNKPYILTIMTKGQDIKKLSVVLSEISKTIYENLSVSPSVNSKI